MTDKSHLPHFRTNNEFLQEKFFNEGFFAIDAWSYFLAVGKDLDNFEQCNTIPQEEVN